MIQDEQKKYSQAIKIEQPEIHVKRAEVEKLRQEIAEMRKQLAEKKAEIRPEVFVETAQEGAPGAEQVEAVSISATQATQPNTQAPQAIDADDQVKILCELAFQKGVDIALKAAQEFNNPYVLDEFHDTLVDQLYERLISEKKIEKE